jgi:hypothetical protein
MGRLLPTIAFLLVLMPLATTASAGGPGNAPGQSAPTNTSPPTISGNAIQSETLTASPGDWSGPNATYSNQWNRCDSSGAACTPMSGATAQTYTPVAADVSSTFRVAVTATNRNGSAVATSAATAAVTAPSAGTTAATSGASSSSSESASVMTTTSSTSTSTTTSSTTTSPTTPTTTSSSDTSQPYLFWNGNTLPGPWSNDAPSASDPSFPDYAYTISDGPIIATRLRIDANGGALTSSGIKTALQENRVYSHTHVGEETWYRSVFRFPVGHYFPTSGDFNIHQQWHSSLSITGAWNTFTGVRCGSSPGVDCRLILVRRAGTLAPTSPYRPAIDEAEDVFAPGSLRYDHWYESLVRIKWYPDNRGSISWYVDGQLAYENLSTPTLLQDSTGNIDLPAYDCSNYRRNDVTRESLVDFDLAAIGPSRASVGG